MDLKQLEALVQVIKLKSFSKAAKALYLTQPTVSAHITSLEKELGAVLVVRTTKEVSPSVKGRQLYGYALKMLELRDRAVCELSDEQSEENRTVRFVVSSSLCELRVRRIAGELHNEKGFDGILDIRKMGAQQAEHEVLKGAAHIAITSARGQNDRLKYFPLASFSALIAFSKSAMETAPRALCAENFSGRRLSAERDAEPKEALRWLRRLGVAPLKPSLCASLDELVSRIENAEGYAFVMPDFREQFPGAEITLVEPETRVAYPVYLVTHKKRPLSKQAKQVVRLIKQQFAGEA